MAHDGAGWLTTVFTHAAQQAGADADTDSLIAEAEDLEARWSESGRTCHNLKYLARVLEAIDELAGCAHAPHELQLAAFYHGSVFYVPKRLDFLHAGRNVAAGATLARTRLPVLGVPTDAVERIGTLIDSASEFGAAADVDQQVFHDALLTTLTMAPQDYKEYRERMSGQYEHLPRRLYLLGRRRQIAALLGRDSIFSSPLGGQDEEIARSNLESELARIATELGDDGTDDNPAETYSGPPSGTIIIKGIKATPIANEEDDHPAAEETIDSGEPEAADIAEEDHRAQDVSSLESVVDDIDDFAGAHSPRAPKEELPED